MSDASPPVSSAEEDQQQDQEEQQPLPKRKSAAGTLGGVQEDRAVLDVAKKKRQALRTAEKEYQSELKRKQQQLDAHKAETKKFEAARKKLTGQPFQDASEILLDMLAKREQLEADLEAVTARHTTRIERLQLTQDEERVLRGLDARRRSSTAVLPPLKPQPTQTQPTPSPPPRPIGCSDRLVRPPHRRELPALDRGPRLGKAAQLELTSRLHDREVSQRQHKAEQADRDVMRSVIARIPRKTLQKEEEESLVNRVFYAGLLKEQETSKKISEKWSTKQESRKLTLEEVKESNNRLFYGRKEYRSEIRASLRRKYLDSTQLQSTKLPPAAISASINRLTQPVGS